MREEILIKNLQNGDASALDELISMYYQEIPAVLHLACAGSHTGGRCGTGNFLKAVKYLGNFGFSGKFRAFYIKLAKKHLY